MFPAELERNAYRANNGEFGWTREQIPQVVEVLCSQAMAILGGELWYLNEEGRIKPSVPQRQGPSVLYCWNTERDGAESWPNFVNRGAADALAVAERWPEAGELPPGLPGRILCNLTWVSESEFQELANTKSRL
jgi:hypothetical protein